MINLETARPADLAACTAVVLPSKGALAPATLAMLRGYVEGGGHLVTCGRTPRRTLTGLPLDARRLYPASVQQTRFFGRLPTLAYLTWEWLLKYLLRARPALRRLHPTSMHILDLNEPLFALFYAPQVGARLRTAAGRAVPGDYLLQTFRLPATGTTPLLWAGAACAGYRVSVGAGSSTMLGSLPGGSYFTPHYYRLGAGRRCAVRAFWQGLLRPWGLAPPVGQSDGLEIEVQHRPFPGGGLLFLINRLAQAQRGTIRFAPAAGVGGPARTIFAGGASRAQTRPDGALDVALDAAELLVLRWTGARPAGAAGYSCTSEDGRPW